MIVQNSPRPEREFGAGLFGFRRAEQRGGQAQGAVARNGNIQVAVADHIKNNNGGSLAVKQICRANCDAAHCTETLCQPNTSSHLVPNIFGGSSNKRGAWIVKQKASNGTNLVVIGVTPNPVGVYYNDCKGETNKACYVWPQWQTGRREVTFILGPAAVPTDTPTPTATPPPTETPALTNTPEPTETPVDTPFPTDEPTETPEPTNTPIPNCTCWNDSICTPSICVFDQYGDITYGRPIKCNRSASSNSPAIDQEDKNSYCTRTERTKGDVDGDGSVTYLDYLYYVAAKNAGGLPRFVNADINGDGNVTSADGDIIVRTLSQ